LFSFFYSLLLGLHCWQDPEKVDMIHVEMTGPEGSPYERGLFQMEVSLSDRYPFTPPLIKFLTPIYHPNIDDLGRICLEALKPKPNGSWNVTLNIPTVCAYQRTKYSDNITYE
jgi:ubiquitin-conjugating enzyme E2 T